MQVNKLLKSKYLIKKKCELQLIVYHLFLNLYPYDIHSASLSFLFFSFFQKSTSWVQVRIRT